MITVDDRSLASKRSSNTCVRPATLLLCPAGHVRKPLGVQKLLTNIKIPPLIMVNLSRWDVPFVRDHFVTKLLYGSIWPTLHFMQRTIKIPYSEKPPSRPQIWHPAVPLVLDTIAISAPKPSRATKPSRCTCRLRLMHPRISR